MSSKKEILNISYSKLFDLPIPWNTVELYETACKLGFDGVKGDVTPSSDGKLIMCHDSFFSVTDDGKVLEPGCKGIRKKRINCMTAEKCKSLEYAANNAKEYFGYHPKVAELEDLVRVCSEYGKLAYVTVRDKQIEMCVDEVYRLLKKYNMTRQCIINSFSYETLSTMRKKDSDIRLSLVFGPNKPLTTRLVNKAKSLGDCAVCIFWARDTLYAGELLEKSKKAIQYAKENGVEVHFAHGADKDSYKFGVECGFTGFQCTVSDAFK